MLSVAPSSRWQITRALLSTSMSPVTAMSPAVTAPGPVLESWSRFGPSPSILSAICLTLSTMSVTSSRTKLYETRAVCIVYRARYRMGFGYVVDRAVHPRKRDSGRHVSNGRCEGIRGGESYPLQPPQWEGRTLALDGA